MSKKVMLAAIAVIALVLLSFPDSTEKVGYAVDPTVRYCVPDSSGSTWYCSVSPIYPTPSR